MQFVDTCLKLLKLSELVFGHRTQCTTKDGGVCREKVRGAIPEKWAT